MPTRSAGCDQSEQSAFDQVIVPNRSHLAHILREYEQYFNHARPHQGINQRIPYPKVTPLTSGKVACHQVLGGIIHDYYRIA